MIQTSVSTKYQVVIPKAVRRKIKVKPGQKLNVYTSGDNIILTPKKEWPDDYIKDIGGLLEIEDVQLYMDEERSSWDDE